MSEHMRGFNCGYSGVPLPHYFSDDFFQGYQNGTWHREDEHHDAA